VETSHQHVERKSSHFLRGAIRDREGSEKSIGYEPTVAVGTVLEGMEEGGLPKKEKDLSALEKVTQGESRMVGGVRHLRLRWVIGEKSRFKRKEREECEGVGTDGGEGLVVRGLRIKSETAGK